MPIRFQVGQLEPILVPDTDPPVKLYVELEWHDLKAFLKRMHNLTEDDDGDVMDEFVIKHVHSWENVFAKDGTPLKPDAEGVCHLNSTQLKALIGAIADGGEAGSGDPLPVTPSGDSSEEPPAS